MNFIKGILIGGALSAGMVFLYKETMTKNGRKLLRRGKKSFKRMAKSVM